MRCLKSFSLLAVFFMTSILSITMLPRKAAACCSCFATVSVTETEEWIGLPDGTYWDVTTHTFSEFTALKGWMVNVFFEDNLLPSLMLKTEQIAALSLDQAKSFGMFLDARTQMETVQAIEKAKAQANKDYQPSVGMCEFGSSVKSLAASERTGEFNMLLMARRSQDRALGNTSSASATGYDSDMESRKDVLLTKFCSPDDSNGALADICENSEGTRANMNIDFGRAVQSPWTLDVNFTDAELSDDESALTELANNLYGHEVFTRPTNLDPNSDGSLSGIQKTYMDARALVAKRSVAENSFNAITALKSAGAPGSKAYLQEIIKELGVTEAGDIDKMLGENPSYYAQMEVLSKKIAQNPDFYTNLYDKPANVARKGVALQAIGLMQKFDLFKSYLRQEAALSVLLETAVLELQDEVENEEGTAGAGGGGEASN